MYIFIQNCSSSSTTQASGVDGGIIYNGTTDIHNYTDEELQQMIFGSAERERERCMRDFLCGMRVVGSY